MSKRPLTSTTAPGKIFASRSELAEHYKSDWHKYNLKRREADMPMLTHPEFTARLEAAMALRREREGREARVGKDHLKDKNQQSASEKKKKNQQKKNGNGGNGGNGGGGGSQRISKRQTRMQERKGLIDPVVVVEEDQDPDVEEDPQSEEPEEDEEIPEINPKQSLFDDHISPDVATNIEYMYQKYGFFIPDREFLIDPEGLIGYCAEKIKIGHTCLYSQRIFRTWRGCQRHMVNARHCKLRYEAGVDLEEFDVFYDFSKDNEEFLRTGIGNHKTKRRAKKRVDGAGGNGDDQDEDEDENMQVVDEENDEDEWEDVDSDEEMQDDDDGLYAAYEDEVAKHGFDITPLGELVFPDGRIIGHRGLSRYYKQRFAPEDSRTSVAAARRANGERLLNGRVYDTYAMAQQEAEEGGDGEVGDKKKMTTLQLARAGLTIGAAAGRSGKGILVPTGGAGSNPSSFTALSLYRYRAVMKKAKREEFQGRRLQQRTTLAMNKMDKKANRLMNNVSVAHAKR